MLNTTIAPWPHYDYDEQRAAQEVLMSGKVNQWTGTHVKEFEKEFATYVGTEYAVAVSNGSVALDLIFKHLPRGFGSVYNEVLVTSRTFMASVSSIVLAGLKPVFVDVDEYSGNIDIADIRRKITDKTMAILCVHLAGQPCDMDEIMAIAKERRLFVIEDCAQSHGATYKGRKVGSIGHAAAWSFCQDKIMSTAGEGGMITTNDYQLFKYIWEFKDHGKNYDKMNDANPSKGFRWVHDSFGSNYRMTEIQAAVGRIQLQKLDEWVERRNKIARFYNGIFYEYSAIEVPSKYEHGIHAKYKHYVYVNEDGLKEGWNRDRIVSELNEVGVPCYTGSCSEVYMENAFLFSDMAPERCLPNARKLGRTSLMFLVHPTITNEDLLKMEKRLDDVLSRASKNCNAN
jgi:dTDP-4-amino-4,6-dideoxygalactose transaminase